HPPDPAARAQPGPARPAVHAAAQPADVRKHRPRRGRAQARLPPVSGRHGRALAAVRRPRAVQLVRVVLGLRLPHQRARRRGDLGRNLMFHFFTLGFAHFARDMHAWRGPSTTVTIDDFVGPDSPPAAKQAGLPYIKGGICETGATLMLHDEASVYAAAPNSWGKAHK